MLPDDPDPKKTEPKKPKLERDLDGNKKEVARKILRQWKEQLVQKDYNSHYFSRARHNQDDGAFCKENGLFMCQGVSF